MKGANDKLIRELTSIKDITFKEQNVGLILVNKSAKIEFVSSSLKNEYGSSISEGIQLPQEFDTTRFLSLVAYEESEYLLVNLEIQAENDRFKFLILLETKFLLEYFPQEMLYSVCYDEIKSILDCVKEGVYITDEEGNTLLLNKEAEKSWSLPVEELVGRNMRDLYRSVYKGISDEEIEKNSVSLQVINKKEEISMIQTGRNDQFKILVTGTPYFKDGKISKVISTERNLTELIDLRKKLEQNVEITSKYEAELEYYRSLNFKGSNMIVKDKKMESLLQLAYKVANKDTTVLLHGESGVGKEVFAKFIHNNSSRQDKSFIEINCAAIPENLLESELFGYEKGAFTGASNSGKVGLFELADQGTLFLDEISELPLHLQSKILRAVQERKILRVGGNKPIPIDVRIISATNKDLKEAVEKKLFREDLYYRLNVVKLSIPPLRERKDDIQALIPHFLNIINKKNNTKINISSNALNLLCNYEWPGNVRQLANVLEAALVTCNSDKITSTQLIEIFPDMQSISKGEHLSLKEEVMLYEKQLILSKMHLFKSTQEMADSLNIDKSTLIRKMNRYGIKNIYVST